MPQEWFIEKSDFNPGFGLALTKDKVLYSGTTPFQKIEIFENKLMGRVFLLDDIVMLTEKDEFVYHEMITHVPMCVKPDSQKILVIGGGDGGTVRELVRYPQVQQIDMVEIDEQTCEVAKEYLPTISYALDHPKVNLVFADGVEFVANTQEHLYDLVIVDSTDPISVGEGLFTKEFYRNCYRILKPDGILVNQSETPFVGEEIVVAIYHKLNAIFPTFQYYQAAIPTYPGGMWLFGFASKQLSPTQDYQPEVWKKWQLATRYYNTKLHLAAFVLPNFVQELISHKD